MGIISSLNPYGRPVQLVDKLIGDAYPVVKNVYENMEYIILVGANLTASTVGQPLLVQRGVVLDGVTGEAGDTTVIPFTDMDVNYQNILNSSVRILGSDNALYFSDSGNFTSKVTSAGLSITLSNTAPAALEEAIVQWFFIYGGDG